MEQDYQYIYDEEPNINLSNVCKGLFFSSDPHFRGNPLIYCLGARVGESEEDFKNYINSLSQNTEPEMEM